MCAQIYLYATLCTGKVLTFVVLCEPESKRYASLYLAWTADTQETGVESLPPIDFLAAAVGAAAVAVGAAQCVSVKLAVGGNLMSAGDTEQLGQPPSITFTFYRLTF